MSCHYYVERKSRFCTMTPKVGSKYCGEHVFIDPENQDRIPCPLNPKQYILN